MVIACRQFVYINSYVNSIFRLLPRRIPSPWTTTSTRLWLYEDVDTLASSASSPLFSNFSKCLSVPIRHSQWYHTQLVSGRSLCSLGQEALDFFRIIGWSRSYHLRLTANSLHIPSSSAAPKLLEAALTCCWRCIEVLGYRWLPVSSDEWWYKSSSGWLLCCV